jgi:hypothetical protein
MTTKEQILKNLFIRFKELIIENLFNIVMEPNYDMKKMDYRPLFDFITLIFKNICILNKIYINLSKLEGASNLLTKDQIEEDYDKNRLMFINRLFPAMRKVLRDIKLPDYKHLTLGDYLALRELLYLMYELHDIAQKLLNKKYIFTEESYIDAVSYIKNEAPRIDTRDTNSTSPNGTVLHLRKAEEGSNKKKLKLGLNKNILYNSLDDCAIVVKFSEAQFVFNKKNQSLIHIHQHYAKHTGHSVLPEYNDKVLRDLKNNTRENLSVIASTVFINKNTLKNIMNLFLLSENIEAAFKAYSLLNRIYIKNIFIVDSKYESGPSFFSQLNFHFFENPMFFNINHLSLDDFSLFYATLQKEQKNYRKVKLDLCDGINIKNDLSIDSNHIYKYFSKFTDLNQSIFIFVNCKWSSVLENLYKYGIEVSGGSLVKRHLLSPMDFSLSYFVDLFSINSYKDTVITTNLLNKSLYESKFSKKIEYKYNKDLFRDKILNYTENLYVNNYGLGFNGQSVNNQIDNELLYNIKYFTLNNWIIKFGPLKDIRDFTRIQNLSLSSEFEDILLENLNLLSTSILKKNSKHLNKRESNLLYLAKKKKFNFSKLDTEYSTKL